MSERILAQPATCINTFVPATAPLSDYDLGRRAYMTGKRISTCSTDAMTQGWLAAEEHCRQMYWTAMSMEKQA